jgi:imidazolonepropionase-like amidohydrolase
MGRVPDSKVIVNCTVVDGTDAPAKTDAGIHVEGDRILSVGPVDDVLRQAGDAEVIDLAGAYVTPGLMNMHVHLGLSLPGAAGLALASETLPQLTLRMAGNARAALHAGITTVRLVGERGYTDFALRAAIGRGEVEGPRIFTAGHSIACTGGHGTGSGRAVEADGAAEFRRAVRTQIKQGADLIKLMLTGGVAGEHEGMDTPQLGEEELRAVMEVAHQWGRKVTAHAGPAESIRQAIEAGLDGVEHGYGLDESVVALMLERGTWYVPTISVTRCGEYFERIGVPAWMAERSLSSGPTHWRSLQLAIEGGVKIALGTDMIPAEPFEGTVATVRELEHMVDAGMSPLRALQAATARPAEMLGVSAELGTVEPGKLADLLAVGSDPAQSASAFRDVLFVMKDGRVVRGA